MYWNSTGPTSPLARRAGRSGRRSALAASVLAMVAAFAVGCGSEGAPVEATSAGLSSADSAALARVLRIGRWISRHNAAVVWELKRGDSVNVAAMRRAVVKLEDTLDDADDVTLEIESQELKRALKDTLSPRHAVALDYARLAYYIDNPAPDPSVEDRIGADIQKHVLQARQADRQLHRRLAASLSPEQRRQIYERIRQRKLG